MQGKMHLNAIIKNIAGGGSSAHAYIIVGRPGSGRDGFIKKNDFSLELDDYYKMTFDYAVEDSPKVFKFFDHLPDLKVLVFDRPWNRECEFPNGNYRRCLDWKSIRDIVASESEALNP